MTSQDGECIENDFNGGLFQEIVRYLNIGKIFMGKIFVVRHAVTIAPIHFTSQGRTFLLHAEFGHDRIKTQYLMPGQGQFRHGVGI
jgi:hypothetical protein